MTGPVVLENDRLRVTIDPGLGGAVTGILHKGSGLSVLGRTPWDALHQPEPGLAAATEAVWLTRFTGGWPLLFPNGGEACRVDGVFHGFHGEASVAPWQSERVPDGLRLTRSFFTVPVRMERSFTLAGEVLTLRETAVAEGRAEVPVIWGQHVTFGADLLAGPVIVETGARRVVADAEYDPQANPCRPGAAGAWPVLPGKAGAVDLSRPAAPMASLAYLTDFARPFAAIRRADGAIGAVLSWEPGDYPCAWYWCELGGTAEGPWFGRGCLIGIEPCSTPLGSGLAGALAAGAPVVRLTPGVPVTKTLCLQVTAPAARVAATAG